MRPGDDQEEVLKKQEELRLSHSLDSVILSTEGLPVSSRMVRAALEKGEDISGLVPPKVEKYIKEQRLYQGGV